MKTFIEVNKSPAKFCLKTGLVTVNGDPVSAGEMIELCAWCSNDLTPKLKSAGYDKISHGLCESCNEKIGGEL